MIITKTPYRISLFGGGTDHPAWYREHGGEVISFAIDKYCYLTSRVLPPFFDHKYRIAYSKVEMTKTIAEIQHPAVRGAVRKYCPNLSLEIHHDGDLPARSGVGSSSAFAVGIIHSLSLLQNRVLSNSELADEAIKLEQIELNENVGSQDQIACALGGLNHITFGGKPEWRSNPISISDAKKKEIEYRTILIYTGLQRSSSDVQANLLIDLDKKTTTMQRTIELTRECRQVLTAGLDLDQIGEMLVESWSLKKAMNSQAITPALENVWEKSQQAGALGGKVLGAGGGGFCMFWVKVGMREEFLERFNFGTHVPIKISDTGSTCVLK
jgi:D-glycero-alpha-D-manno-heptose-7-phosphate kinase